jgi:hypothetical protein
MSIPLAVNNIIVEEVPAQLQKKNSNLAHSDTMQ